MRYNDFNVSTGKHLAPPTYRSSIPKMGECLMNAQEKYEYWLDSAQYDIETADVILVSD
jgi:hypothetical protein